MDKIIIFILLGLSSHSFAAESFSGKDAMNGISFETYKEFPKEWKLVTIRYRKDTGEMRLTYANEVAMKTLMAGSINYPDGSVFAKTGIHTGVDDQFESSVIPKGIRRYQLMVKDKKKYSTSGGWGYGLFDPEGKTFPEDPVVTQNACYACHAIVENRGQVFSQPFSFIDKTHFPDYKKAKGELQLKFVIKNYSELPESLKKHVSKDYPKIQWLSHKKLSQNVFQGTLDELKPILEREVRANHKPAIFASQDGKRFVIVTPQKINDCMDSGAFKIISTGIDLKIVEESYCTND